MTEPITIHDVDVSGCYFYTKYCCTDCRILGACGNNPDCYYKQLQCEKRLHKHTQDLLDQALKDNEESEKRLEEALLDDKMMCINSLNDDVCKLTQALTDIREIAESSHEYLAKMLVNDLYNDLNQILAKVKEVIE